MAVLCNAQSIAWTKSGPHALQAPAAHPLMGCLLNVGRPSTILRDQGLKHLKISVCSTGFPVEQASSVWLGSVGVVPTGDAAAGVGLACTALLFGFGPLLVMGLP